MELRKRVDQAAMNRWAELSGDFNPLHVDPEAAARTRYSGTILHGHLTIAWLMEWALLRFGPDWLGRGSLTGLRFRRPLRPDVDYRVVGTDGDEPGSYVVSVVLPDGEAGVVASARLRDQPPEASP